MGHDEEGYATSTEWVFRAETAEKKYAESEAKVDRYAAEVHRLTAENRELQADIKELQENFSAARKTADEQFNTAQVWKRQFQEQIQRVDELTRQLSLLEATEEPERFVDLPELPDAFIRLAIAALERFAEGYAEYGPGAADPLGLAGQWGDLHRKIMKLKRSMWTGVAGTLTRENEEDVLNDVIGHCLLALDMLNRGFEGGK